MPEIKPGPWCFLLLLLLALSPICGASDTGLLVSPTNVTGPGLDDYECQSSRASDYYGIGVRLVSHSYTGIGLREHHGILISSFPSSV